MNMGIAVSMVESQVKTFTLTLLYIKHAELIFMVIASKFKKQK